MPHRPSVSLPLVLAGLALAGLPGPAAAAESYDSCAGTIASLPATISTQGVWCLQGDLSTAITSGAAITVAANNVTIDCNGFKLGGLAAGAGTETVGIFIDTRQNAVVRNCHVRGFLRGIHTEGGGGHIVERNRIVASTFIGIDIGSDGSVVRDNLVTDTGGSTLAIYSVGIATDGAVDVLDNGISGVVSPAGIGSATGILVAGASGATVRGNRINGLVPSAEPNVCGICAGSPEVIIEGNTVSGPGVVGSVGIYCEYSTATATRNTIARSFTGVSTCWEFENAVNPN